MESAKDVCEFWSGLGHLAAEAGVVEITNYIQGFQAVRACEAPAAPAASAASTPSQGGEAGEAGEAPAAAEATQEQAQPGPGVVVGPGATKVDTSISAALRNAGWKFQGQIAAAGANGSPVQQAFSKALESFVFGEACFGQKHGVSADRHIQQLCWARDAFGQGSCHHLGLIDHAFKLNFYGKITRIPSKGCIPVALALGEKWYINGEEHKDQVSSPLGIPAWTVNLKSPKEAASKDSKGSRDGKGGNGGADLEPTSPAAKKAKTAEDGEAEDSKAAMDAEDEKEDKESKESKEVVDATDGKTAKKCKKGAAASQKAAKSGKQPAKAAKAVYNLQVGCRVVPFTFIYQTFLQRQQVACDVKFYHLFPAPGVWEEEEKQRESFRVKPDLGTSGEQLSPEEIEAQPHLYSLVAPVPPGYVSSVPKVKGKGKGKSGKGNPEERKDPSKEPFWAPCGHLFK